MTRQVTINLSESDMIKIAETIGTWDKLWEAIGYLSTWNLSYPYVTIHHDTDADLVAVYRDTEGNRQYVIGAVWHGTHYGYHS